MDRGPLTDRIVEAFEAMPAQLQSAARYVLERPDDVALLSMREQARRAGVQPATMTRLAKRLGLDGYDTVRSLYAEAIRGARLGFAGRAGLQVATQRAKGDQALAAEMVAGMRREIGRLGEPETLARLADAAELLAGARRIYCLGLRACYPVAWNMNYVLSLLGDRAVLVDAAGNIGTDRIGAADAADVLLAASVEPYTRATIETATHAADQGVPIVAITDSHLSPLARLAREVILVSTEAPSFFHSMTPGFAAAEILAALVAGRGAEQSLAAIRRTEAHLAAFNVHWQNSESRRSR